MWEPSGPHMRRLDHVVIHRHDFRKFRHSSPLFAFAPPARAELHMTKV